VRSGPRPPTGWQEPHARRRSSRLEGHSTGCISGKIQSPEMTSGIGR
jgi:hypothetical protein